MKNSFVINELPPPRTIKFCAYLFNEINFEPDALQPCCDTLKVGVPCFPFSGGDVDMQAYTQHIQKTLMTLQESEKVCAGCHFLQEIPYQDFSAAVPRFRTVSLNKHRHWCNLRCEYCDLWEERSDSYDILPPIKSLHQQGALQKGCSFSWGGGEPSILKEFEAASTWIAEQGYPQYVHTNAVRFSPAICHLLQTGRGAINVSLDASCKETYQAMKGVNAFDRVVRNLRRYIEAAQDKTAVHLKYIVYSKNNDPQEIMGFCELCQQLGVRKIQFSLDFRDVSADEVSDESLRSALLLYKTARKMGIECEPFFVPPQILQRMNALAQQVPNNPLSDGIAAFNTGDFALAIHHLSTAMTQEPANPVPLAYLAFVAVRQGLLPEAQNLFTQCERLAPERHDLKAAFGEVLLQAGQNLLAVEYLVKAVGKQSDWQTAYPTLAEAVRKQTFKPK